MTVLYCELFSNWILCFQSWHFLLCWWSTDCLYFIVTSGLEDAVMLACTLLSWDNRGLVYSKVRSGSCCSTAGPAMPLWWLMYVKCRESLWYCYWVQLQSTNEEGNSKWSEVVCFRTLPDRPQQPLRLQVKGRVTSNNFRCTWGQYHLISLSFISLVVVLGFHMYYYV